MLRVTNLQVWVARKEHAKHVPYLPLIPVGTTEDRNNARYRVRFSGVRLYPNPTGVCNAEHVVYNLEALLSFREVHCGDIDDTLELTLRVVSQEGQDGNYCGGRDVKYKLILED